MIKSIRFLFLTVSLVLLFTTVSLGTMYNPDDMSLSSSYTEIQPRSISVDEEISSDHIKPFSVSSKIMPLMQVIGITLSIFILLPICLVCGILYMVKSKSNKSKKISTGIFIIIIPFIILILCLTVPVIYSFLTL